MNINGITVKNLKTFKGHEGETCFQGNLYLGKKKIAEWSQDSWGAICDILRMEPGYSEELLRKAIIEKNQEKATTHKRSDGSTFVIEYDLESLMTDLIELKEAEKRYKKAASQGYCISVDMIGSLEIRTRWYGEKYKDYTDKEIIEDCREDIAEVQENCFRDETVQVKIYRDLTDFEIGEEINLKDISK